MARRKPGPEPNIETKMNGLQQRRIMAHAAASYNSFTIGEACLEIMADDPSMTLADCERMLRDLGSNAYLVAWPEPYIPPPYVPYDPIRRHVVAYALWVCLHGRAERDKKFEEWNTAGPAENMQRLAECGFSVESKHLPSLTLTEKRKMSQ